MCREVSPGASSCGFFACSPPSEQGPFSGQRTVFGVVLSFNLSGYAAKQHRRGRAPDWLECVGAVESGAVDRIGRSVPDQARGHEEAAPGGERLPRVVAARAPPRLGYLISWMPIASPLPIVPAPTGPVVMNRTK